MKPNFRVPVLDERNGAFAALRDRRVLIYWPHGFGDFVHLGHLLPLLEPSNAYYLTRFGDDFVHLYDADGIATPVYSGVRRIEDGRSLGAAHFGINFKRIKNREETIAVPEPLYAALREARIDTVLYTDYPERPGSLGYPYHTKIRSLARDLVTPQRLASFDLSQPLATSLRFRAPIEEQRLIEERLRTYVARGERLYLIAPGGHTEPGKVWPDGYVLQFAKSVHERDAKARALVIDQRRSEGLGRGADILPTTADLFGDTGVAFAHLLVTLVRACAGFVGVASGPLHAAMAIGACPTVGIWLAHHPDWYDEPSRNAVHLTGPRIFERGLDRRPSSIDRPAALRHRITACRDRTPDAQDALVALESLGERFA